MKLINFKKGLFFVFVLINISNSLKAGEFQTFKVSKYDHLKNSKKIFLGNYKKNLNKYLVDSNLEIIKEDYLLSLKNHRNNKEELEIKSKIQSEDNNNLYAEGDVIVTFKGFILKADKIIYDKTKKTIDAKGNISLIFGEQFFEMSSLVYDFNNQKGALLEVKGLINTSNLLEDLFSNSETSDIKNIEILKKLKKDKVINSPNKVENWVFFTDKLEIDGDKWFSEKAILTNDLLELNQVKIEINSLEAISAKENIRFKSSLNYLILEEKLPIPFWAGSRTLSKSREGLGYQKKWNIGFDNVDKDGYFIGRKFNTINLFNDFLLDIEPQFLIQRTLKGNTKSFIQNGDSPTSDKVKQDTKFVDYFALNSQIKGKFSNWDFEIDKELYSFDPEKFSDAIRVKSNLSKEITFLNSKWDNSFYGVYRDRVWNGSIGEAEIYIGYGSKLEKQNTWEVNGIRKTQKFSLGLANLKGEALNSKNLVTNLKGNLFYSFDQNFPIQVDYPSTKFIDSSYKYIAKPIKKGISLNSKVELLYSLYETGNSQKYIGFGAGPEFVFGNFKQKYFDYTRISLLPFYKIKEGDSTFKFDQISDLFTLDIALDQQLYGPLILNSIATLNLDSNSKNYGRFISSKISLDWKRRSYEFGIFYQPHNQAGGIAFTLFGFK